MSPMRAFLAELKLGFVPKVGKKYQYESDGPFGEGPIITPMEIRRGYVKYEVKHRYSSAYTTVCSVGAFASMCVEDK